MGKICRQFRPKVEHDEACLLELERWFLGLLEDDTPDLMRKAVTLSLDRLPKKRIEVPREVKKNRPKTNRELTKVANIKPVKKKWVPGKQSNQNKRKFKKPNECLKRKTIKNCLDGLQAGVSINQSEDAT
ncbi:hypothetical protein JTB14_034183 [Gonioctena quinquepunctata]|nr:hypothetical protein JTB14_034183 [Gonioctena quinquepunctata]